MQVDAKPGHIFVLNYACRSLAVVSTRELAEPDFWLLFSVFVFLRFR